MRHMVDILQEVFVARVNLTAINDIICTVVDCFSVKYLKLKKIFKNIVCIATGILLCGLMHAISIYNGFI